MIHIIFVVPLVTNRKIESTSTNKLLMIRLLRRLISDYFDYFLFGAAAGAAGLMYIWKHKRNVPEVVQMQKSIDGESSRTQILFKERLHVHVDKIESLLNDVNPAVNIKKFRENPEDSSVNSTFIPWIIVFK